MEVLIVEDDFTSRILLEETVREPVYQKKPGRLSNASTSPLRGGGLTWLSPFVV